MAERGLGVSPTVEDRGLDRVDLVGAIWPSEANLFRLLDTDITFTVTLESSSAAESGGLGFDRSYWNSPLK